MSNAATIKSGLPPEAKSQRIDTTHSEFMSLCNSLSQAIYRLKSAQECADIIIKGSLLAIFYRVCLRDELVLQQGQKKSEAAAY